MSNLCSQLHELLAECVRHHFPFDKKAIPPDGIYVLYEAGEHGHGADRIVRVGTHTGEAQLKSFDPWRFQFTRRGHVANGCVGGALVPGWL